MVGVLGNMNATPNFTFLINTYFFNMVQSQSYPTAGPGPMPRLEFGKT